MQRVSVRVFTFRSSDPRSVETLHVRGSTSPPRIIRHSKGMRRLFCSSRQSNFQRAFCMSARCVSTFDAFRAKVFASRVAVLCRCLKRIAANRADFQVPTLQPNPRSENEAIVMTSQDQSVMTRLCKLLIYYAIYDCFIFLHGKSRF